MRSRLRAFAASLLGFAVLVVTTRAHAREVSFGLSWRTEASTACVDEAALRDAVEQRLARKPFVDPGQAEILLEAEESGAGDRYRARVTERDRRGTILGVRTLEAQSCESLRRASTLIVTLIIDDVTSARAKEVEPPPEDRVVVSEPPPPPPPRPPPPPPLRLREAPPRVAPPPKLSSRSSLRFSLGLGLGLSVGALPSPSATIFGLARLEPVGSRWSFDWSGGYALSQRLDRGPVSGEFAAVEQRVRSCFGFARWTSSKLDACGGIAWGVVIPTTSGVLQSSDRWRMLVGPTAAVAFEQRARANALRLELGLFFSLRQYDFSYLNLARQQSAFYSTDAIIFFVGLSGHGTIS